MIDEREATHFQSASRDVLRYLHERLGFGLWMVTRTQERDWIVLQSEDHGYSVKDGDVFQWADSFCSRMVAKQGPRIAPSSDDVPAYAEAPIGRQVKIGAYIGLPLSREDGDLFGTLCAIDPKPQPNEIIHELPQIELMARLLETILESELKASEEARRAERAEAQAMTDSLTGLFNRRGWDKLLDAEETRCRRYAHPAAVITVDLDNLKTVNDQQGHCSGDRLIQAAASALRENLRSTDILARVGGDEFLILAVECSESGGEKLVTRLQQALDVKNISASIGWGYRQAYGSLHEACAISDQAMYDCKRRKKATGGGDCLRSDGRPARCADIVPIKTSLLRHKWHQLLVSGEAMQNRCFSPRIRIRSATGTGEPMTDSRMSFSASRLN